MVEDASYFVLSIQHDPPERPGNNSEHFNPPPLQSGRPGMKRLTASDDSSPLMSLTAINSTQGSRAQHSPPPAALLPGLGFFYTPPLPAEGLELKLELWQWAM